MAKKKTALKAGTLPVASMVVRNIDAMSRDQREAVAQWLNRQAINLVVDGDKYAKRFTARLGGAF